MSAASDFSAAEVARIVEEVMKRLGPQLLGPGSTGAAPAADCGCHTAPPARSAVAAAPATPPPPAERIGSAGEATAACQSIGNYIDHTLLKANATEDEVKKLCREALEYTFASVCVNTTWVPLCARLLAGSPVKVCCVVGFPLGAMSTEAKAFETSDAVTKGAQEIDMVINVGMLQSGNFDFVLEDIAAVVKAASGAPVKVILETSLLDEDQKIAACVLSKAARAAFVKTSTGFSTGGATPEDIALMRRIVGQELGVKASGGIRDCATAQAMIEQGATRLGASAGIAIVEGKRAGKGY